MVVNFSAPVCFSEASVVGPNMLVIYSLLLVSALAAIFILRKTDSSRLKAGLVYIHLILLFMPIALMSTNTACGLTCSSCHNNLPVLFMYSIPITAAAAAFFGFVGVPLFYTLSNRRIKTRWIKNFVRRYSASNIQLCLLNTAKPVAFSFKSLRSGIFLSVGMLEILTKDEIEAVLLHEISHIKRLSSVTKFSQKLLMFSPFYKFAGFNGSDKLEEEAADKFAISIQKTDKYLQSAKRKMDKFG
ncbi:MAG: M48 family metalloprotease [Candidatus Aenigmarchaeota archaeon]|nr:M48 family metalloprotease [Candidatus Aenigmarchaeota archaeon]